MEPCPGFTLWQFESCLDFLYGNPNVWCVGGKVFDREDAEQPKVGKHNVDASRIMHATKPVKFQKFSDQTGLVFPDLLLLAIDGMYHSSLYQTVSCLGTAKCGILSLSLTLSWSIL